MTEVQRVLEPINELRNQSLGFNISFGFVYAWWKTRRAVDGS
ncbi:MAG TPA: hypothetical protein VKA87_01845 [Nitrososphaeraceae archaeon]|nr:hypothetical protein [Nitrososphaeraceae archaeon]